MRYNDRIPIPWKHRWRAVREQYLPVLTFLLGLALVVWLWQRHVGLPTAVGEVEAKKIDVCARIDGRLLAPGNGSWSLFDTVEKGQVIARLDDRFAMASLKTLRLELARLHEELAAAEARLQTELADRQVQHRSDVERLQWQIENLRLDILDRKATIEADKIALGRLDRRVELLEPMHRRGVISEAEQVDARLLRKEVAERIEQNTVALHTAQAQHEAATERLRQFPPLELPDTERLLAPLRASITAQESRIEELQLEIESLALRAPMRAVVTAIHRVPGQEIRAGDPILSLAADEGKFVVSYVREDQKFAPEVGMPVEVRLRGSRTQRLNTVVERVGPQVELVPPHQRRNQNRPEWGQPVRIRVPEGIPVAPGELVDITFDS